MYPKIVKVIRKSQSRFRLGSQEYFVLVLEKGFDIGFRKLGIGNKFWYRFRKIESQTKSLGFSKSTFRKHVNDILVCTNLESDANPLEIVPIYSDRWRIYLGQKVPQSRQYWISPTALMGPVSHLVTIDFIHMMMFKMIIMGIKSAPISTICYPVRRFPTKTSQVPQTTLVEVGNLTKKGDRLWTIANLDPFFFR